MIQKILEQGDPILSQICEEVPPEAVTSAEVQQVITDMVQTLKSTTGVGLAAPQIGKLLRIVIVDEPLTVIVNPVLTPVGSGQQETMEGCLSVPGMRGSVTRPSTVRVEGLQRNGKPYSNTFTGFRAAVVQHEVDHLNGILYTERAAFTFPDDAVNAPTAPPPAVGHTEGTDRDASGRRKTFVIKSPEPMGGTQHVTWTFHQRGRVVELRVAPGGAMVTGVWLAGVRLRARGFKTGVLTEKVVGPGLHVNAGDQLRVEFQIQKGKKRIVAEADFDG